MEGHGALRSAQDEQFGPPVTEERNLVRDLKGKRSKVNASKRTEMSTALQCKGVAHDFIRNSHRDQSLCFSFTHGFLDGRHR